MAKNRCALITGSARGLGAAIARRLASDSWVVAVNDIDEAATHSLVNEINDAGLSAVAAVADATDKASIASLVQSLEMQVGPISAAILNATGPQPEYSLENTDWKELSDELDFFVKSPHIVSQAVLPSMQKLNSGRIVHIDSEVTTKLPPHRTNYITAKSAQIGLARSWALEVAGDGITVNTIAPGFVPVERHDVVSPEDIEAYRSTVPMQRMGKTKDIAGVVAFLLSEDASFITGQRIVVDGGRHLV